VTGRDLQIDDADLPVANREAEALKVDCQAAETLVTKMSTGAGVQKKEGADETLIQFQLPSILLMKKARL
jgi:hypothetical protein